jgi:transcriptional regulator with XRE-family HTH domain
VRLLVEERGMTAQDVADSTGIGARAVENRMSGLAPWTTDELWVLAHVLDVDVVSLFRE